MDNNVQPKAERSLTQMLWLLRVGRYLMLAGGVTFFLWEAGKVSFSQQPWTIEASIQAFYVSITAPTLLWLTASWAERLAREVNRQYTQMHAVNRMAQAVVSERADLETNLGETRVQMRLLQAVNRVLSYPLPPMEATDQMLDVALETLSLDAAEVWLLAPDANGLRLLSHRGLFPDAFRERTQLRFGEDLPGIAAQIRMPVVSTNLGNETRLGRRAILQAGFASYAAVPLINKGDELIGVLGAACRRPRQPSPAELEALVHMGTVLASTVKPLLYGGQAEENLPVVLLTGSATG